jgi:hypothetical protein
LPAISGPAIKNLHTKFFAKNKPVELTYHKAGLFMQYPQKYQAEKVMKFRVLKVESANKSMLLARLTKIQIRTI